MSARKPQKSWQRERARVLLGLFRALERDVQRGVNLSLAIRARINRYQGRPYRTSPGKVLRLSWVRAWVLFHAWRKSGRNPDVLRLRYCNPAKSEITQETLRAFLTAAEQPGPTSFRGVYRRLPAQHRRRSYDSFRRSFGPEPCRRLTECLRGRAAAQTKLQTLIQRLSGKIGHGAH